MTTKRTILTALAIAILVNLGATAAEWPTYQHDTRRSGVTKEQLEFPLENTWTWTSPFLPQPAWEGPAKWDSYSGQKDLKSMRNFDPAFFVTSVGGSVFFGSSVDDAAHCLDAATGEEKWVYFTDGPVRVAPTYFKGRVYFGSDDGYAYCVNATDGALIWRHKASPQNRLVPSNGKVISLAPVRTGVLVKQGIAYFGASLLPWRPSYINAVDAETGADDVPGAFQVEYENQTMQGAMLASDDNLYALQGRSAPVVYSRDTGERRGTVAGEGGVFALITRDDHLIAGTDSQKTDRFEEKGIERRDQLASYAGANRIVVSGGVAYLQSNDELGAFNREEFLALQAEIIKRNGEKEKLEKELKEVKKKFEETKDEALRKQRSDLSRQIKTLQDEIDGFTNQLADCFPWKVACDGRHALILAGKTLFAGATDKVTAYDSATGEAVWETAVDGAAHGLAVANDRLFVSTDKGLIYAFE